MSAAAAAAAAAAAVAAAADSADDTILGQSVSAGKIHLTTGAVT